MSRSLNLPAPVLKTALGYTGYVVGQITPPVAARRAGEALSGSAAHAA